MARLQTIGRYQVREKLGEGSFGVVYRAYDPEERREVALKVLRPEASTSPELVRRFQREFKLSAKLKHPNIVEVYAGGKTGSTFYIVSALIQGQTLATLIPEEEGLEPWRAAHLAIQLADALSYAHQHKIVHRDVKPGNAMVDEHDHVYLMDFGLATLMEESLSQLTQPGTRMGTLSYMSPEQAMAGLLKIEKPSDVYSAGATLYSMLTGRLPFMGPKEVVVHHVINTAPNPPTLYRPDLDPKLEAICLTAMAKNPQERYRSSKEFSVRLQEWLNAGSVRRRPASSRARRPPQDEVPSALQHSTLLPAPRPRKDPDQPAAPRPLGGSGSNPLGIWAVVLALVLLVAAVLAWFVLFPGGQRARPDQPRGIQATNDEFAP